MAEPGKITNPNLERVNFTTNLTGENGSAVVRRNRTIRETANQFDRLVRGINISENPSRYRQLARAFTNTVRALNAMGQPNYLTPMYGATRRNNRR